MSYLCVLVVFVVVLLLSVVFKSLAISSRKSLARFCSFNRSLKVSLFFAMVVSRLAKYLVFAALKFLTRAERLPIDALFDFTILSLDVITSVIERLNCRRFNLLISADCETLPATDLPITFTVFSPCWATCIRELENM